MRKESTPRLCLTAAFMAMTVALCSFGVPVPGGKLYLCEIVICLAALLMTPFEAFMVGGVGSFLGDFLFYQPPMFVSLVTHGLQAVVISLIAHRPADTKKKKLAFEIIAVSIGAVITVVGYTLGKTFVYSTWQTAVLKLPYEIAQAVIGAVGSLLLYYKGRIGKLFENRIR